MSKYYNYHKHDDYSNIRTPDVAVQFKNYIDRALQLGHDAVFTTNHGTSTEVFYAYDECKKNDLKMIFGIEAYVAKDVNETVRGNHIVLIALNRDGYRAINKINSRANVEGFYYHPRIQLDWLLELNPQDVVVTSACVNSVLKIDGALELLHNHFGNHFFLEIQNHNEDIQKEWNRKILDISNKYNIKLIHGNDSHYIYESGVLGRDGRSIFLNSKGMSYGDEDDFILDYPKYDKILERYEEQGVIRNKVAQKALDNTLIFEKAEDLGFKKNIKMPTIYPELSYDQRFNKLKEVIIEQWNKEKQELKKYDLSDEEFKEYVTAIYNEMKVIKETNKEVHTADYFLFNYEAVKLATEKYNGKLTYSGRGSAVSFYTNYLLNFTKIDRVFAQKDVPIYPSRFISKTRLLETKSLPDIDFNTTSAEPFYKASIDLLGDNHVYPMITFGRLQESGAFRMVCRAKNIEMSEYNAFAKTIGDADEQELLNDRVFGEIYKQSQAFVGMIESSSIHPCSYLIYDEPIDEEVGLTRSGDNIVCNITSSQSDKWKFLKEDFLETDDIRILDDVEKLANITTPNIRDLLINLDEKTWKLYEDGITATLNQASTDHSRNLVMKYNPKNYAELTSFVSAIRPSFSSLLNGYLNRIDYSSGIDELDNLFKITNGYILYQENVMQFLIHLGIKEDEAYSILKRIAKKDETLTDYLNELESGLYKEWCNKGYNEEKFKDAWDVVLNSVGYGFNASHALSTAIISLYQAYYKAHYPLEYYSAILERYQGKLDKTTQITNELPYFDINVYPIKYGKSKGQYFMDKANKSIYKGIGSIKYLNSQVGNELYTLAQSKSHSSFIELLYDIDNTSVNSKQLEILIKLDYFSQFGNDKKLFILYKYFSNLNSRKQLNKESNRDIILLLEKVGITENFISENSSQTEKLYKDINFKEILLKIENNVPNSSFGIKEKMDTQLEYLTYINKQYDVDKRLWYVIDIADYKNPYVKLHNIRTGDEKSIKLFKYDIEKNTRRPKPKDIIMVDKAVWQRKNKKVNGEWVKSNDKQLVLKKYNIVG